MAKIKPLVGMVLYGYCGGVFGRDSYSDKRIEVVAYDYLIARGSDGPELLVSDNELQVLIEEDWLQPEEDM